MGNGKFRAVCYFCWSGLHCGTGFGLQILCSFSSNTIIILYLCPTELNGVEAVPNHFAAVSEKQ